MTDSSDKLGQKLLQGWTMLNEHCMTCTIPLVRNKQRKDYCVQCEKYWPKQSAMNSPKESKPLESMEEMASDARNHKAAGERLVMALDQQLMRIGSEMEKCTDLNTIKEMNDTVMSILSTRSALQQI